MKLFVEQKDISCCYIPKRGDIILVNLGDGSIGTEQGGNRPCVVLNDVSLSKNTYLGIVVPITSKVKSKVRCHYSLPENLNTYGTCLVEQIRSVDLRSRKVRYLDTLPSYYVDQIFEIVKDLLKS